MLSPFEWWCRNFILPDICKPCLFVFLRNLFYLTELHEIEFLVPAFLKDHMLPIASNVFGDNIFICVEGRENGEIFFRYHDRPKRYIKLADDFRTFIQKCKSKKLGRCYTIEDRIAMRRSAGNFEPPSAIALSEWQKEIDYFNRIHQEQVEF